jgi:hypothetical protein
VRQALGKRFAQTPGVIVINPDALACSAYVEGDVFDDYSNEAEEGFEKLLGWETPDGWEIPEAIQLWQHQYQMALEFYSRWNPRPPKPWMSARKAWAQACRYITENNRRNIDSEFLAAAACDRGWYPEEKKILDAWRKIKPTFEPNVEIVWCGEHIVGHIAKWMERERGIVWTAHVEFAKRLEKLTGFPYFGAGGLDARGRSIENYRIKTPIIASKQANQQGRNLQDRWHTNYYSAPMGNSKEWEQTMGRTWRRGQKADVVGHTVLLGCLAQYSSIVRAKSRSEFIKDGSTQDRKLLLADWLIPSMLEVLRMSGPRWSKSKKQVSRN